MKHSAFSVPCALAAALVFASVSARAAEAVPAANPIDLPTALRLAGAQNREVQLARERVNEARANHDQAVYQFFPWISPGVVYRRNDGQIQETTGNIFNVSRQQYTVGANVSAQLELGEAWFKSLAAKQVVAAADHALEARRQEAMHAAATGYFDLVQERAAQSVAGEALRISEEYAGQLRRVVELGLVLKVDALRAQVQVERNQLAVLQARERQRAVAARLAVALRLDPAVDLAPVDAELLPVTLANNSALDPLVAQALNQRPEMKQGAEMVSAAQSARKAATVGPWIPGIGAQIFAGGMGGGQNGATGSFADTESYQVTLGWRVGPGGIFDTARVRAADARRQVAQILAEQVKDEIVRQVVVAHNRVQSLTQQMETLKRALALAEEAFRLTRERKERGVGVVLENILAEQDLTRARLDFVTAVAEFNKAQYSLQRAVGGIGGAATASP